MLQKKVCLLGSFAVGKTSLIAKFVHGIFDERYLTTIGVKIDKCRVTTSKGPATLMIWDLNGQDDLAEIRPANLKGSGGFLFVADGTRPATLEVVSTIDDMTRRIMDEVPRILLLNKWDLREQWRLEKAQIKDLQASGWQVMVSSAKSGENVARAFGNLAEMMVA